MTIMGIPARCEIPGCGWSQVATGEHHRDHLELAHQRLRHPDRDRPGRLRGWKSMWEFPRPNSSVAKPFEAEQIRCASCGCRYLALTKQEAAEFRARHEADHAAYRPYVPARYVVLDRDDPQPYPIGAPEGTFIGTTTIRAGKDAIVSVRMGGATYAFHADEDLEAGVRVELTASGRVRAQRLGNTALDQRPNYVPTKYFDEPAVASAPPPTVTPEELARVDAALGLVTRARDEERQRANTLADEASRLRNENTEVLAENARLRREIDRLAKARGTR